MALSVKKSVLLLTAILALSLILLTSTSNRHDGVPSGPGGAEPSFRSGGDAAAADEMPVTLDVTVAANSVELKALADLSRQWSGKRPHLSIRWRMLDPKANFSDVLRELKYEYRADIYLIENDWINGFAARGVLMPLEAAGDAPSFPEPIPAAERQIRWNELTWGVPFDIDPYILVWNREAAALAEGPPDAWTLAVVRRAAELWASAPDTKMQRFGMYVDVEDAQALAWLAEASGFAPEAAAGEGGVSGAESAEQASAELFEQWIRESAANVSAAADLWSELAEGRLGFAVVRLSQYLAHSGPSIGAGPLPAAEATAPKGRLGLFGRSFVVHADTEFASAAVDWIVGMTAIVSQQEFSRVSGTLPSSREALADVRQGAAPVGEPWIRDGLLEAEALPVSPDLPERMDSVREAANRILSGEPERDRVTTTVSENLPANSP